MARVILKVPSFEDIKYRQEWMKNPNTMGYNAGYKDLTIDGYDYQTGIIDWNDGEMIDWYNRWINKEPDRYFAYIYDVANDKIPIGEIYFYKNNDTTVYNIGILITDENRGKGYGFEALCELQKIAFEKYNASALSDIIPENRIGAIKSFKKAGFVETNLIQEQIVFEKKVIAKQLLLTKENYLERNRL